MNISEQGYASPGDHMRGIKSLSNNSNVASQVINASNMTNKVLKDSGAFGSSSNSNSSKSLDLSYDNFMTYMNDMVKYQMQLAMTNNKQYQDYFNESNSFNQNSANKAMKFSAQQAQLNREYQTYMSNTSYQRAVKDLEAAGLNPILAYFNGGASTPQGSSASSSTAHSSSFNVDEGHNGMSQIISSMFSNMLPIMLNSATSGFLKSPETKKLVNNVAEFGNNIVGSLTDVFNNVNRVIKYGFGEKSVKRMTPEIVKNS